MLRWRFSTYVSATGRRDVQADIDRLDDYGTFDFRAKVRFLAGTSSQLDWHEPRAKKLTNCNGLYEIRFKAHRAQARAIGTFGPGSDEFTILILADHKQNVYRPTDALNTAQRRRKELLGDPSRRDPLKVDGEVFPPTK